MTVNRSIHKHLILIFILVFWVMANVMAQGGTSVYEGETHTYQVENHSGSTYYWVIYNEATFTTAASNTEAQIVSGELTSSITIKWIKPGTYFPTLVETNELGCTNKKALAVVVLGRNAIWPVVKFSNQTVGIGDMKYILANSCQSFTIDASNSTGDGLTYLWEPSVNLDNVQSSTPTFSPGSTTIYKLTVTDVYGHSSSDSVGIMVSQAVKADAGQNQFISENQSGMLDGSASLGDNLLYLWETTDGNILEGNTSGHPVVDQAGKYYLTVTDQYGCTDMDSVLVNLYTQAVKDTTSTEINFTVDINVLANDIPRKNLDPSTLRIVSGPKNGIATVVADSIISYTPNQYYVGNDDFVYSICDYYENCDQATVLVIVNDLPFFIPEGFSPNGDGLNDKFEIKGLAKYKTVEITIFNRWGNVVYQSHNYGNGTGKEGFWDGTAKAGLRIGSGPVPTGTYFYVLKLDGKENINGSIYLDR